MSSRILPDATQAEGDVPVAADGGRSRVRRQFLPHAGRIDTSVVAVAGKVFLDGGNQGRIARELCNGMTLALGPGGNRLFAAPQIIDGARHEWFRR